MTLVTIVGITASFFTAISMLPQLIRIARERRSEGISWWVPVLLFFGVGAWVWYGFMKKDLIIIISNSTSLLIDISILVLSIRYRTQKAHH